LRLLQRTGAGSGPALLGHPGGGRGPFQRDPDAILRPRPRPWPAAASRGCQVCGWIGSKRSAPGPAGWNLPAQRRQLRSLRIAATRCCRAAATTRSTIRSRSRSLERFRSPDLAEAALGSTSLMGRADAEDSVLSEQLGVDASVRSSALAAVEPFAGKDRLRLQALVEEIFTARQPGRIDGRWLRAAAPSA